MNWKKVVLMFSIYSAIVFLFSYAIEPEISLERKVIKAIIQGVIFTIIMTSINYFSEKKKTDSQ